MSVDSVYSFLGSRYVLAPGAIVRIGPLAGVNAFSMKLLSGGTLEVGGWSVTPTATGFTTLAGAADWSNSGGQTFGFMYPLSSNEVFSGNFAGMIHLYAASATCVVSVAFGQSQGNP